MNHLLYLMRHAQSADKQLGQSDKERELTATGMREAIQIGALLKDFKFFPDRILSSTAIRAKQTSELISERAEQIVYEEELYQASVRTFLAQIHLFDESIQKILCVGHNPTISYLAEYLTKAEIGDLPTAGVVIIQFNMPWNMVGEGNGELIKTLTAEII
jgi:phosphohistidine phosphatase